MADPQGGTGALGPGNKLPARVLYVFRHAKSSWDDPSLGIDWPERSPSLSPKDAASPLLADIDRERLPRFAEGG